MTCLVFSIYFCLGRYFNSLMSKVILIVRKAVGINKPSNFEVCSNVLILMVILFPQIPTIVCILNWFDIIIMDK